MNDSILNSMMDALGLNLLHDQAFNNELVMHINSIFSDLTQLGVGPKDGFEISDASTTWADFTRAKSLNNVRTYMFLRLKKIFDPPQYSFVLSAITEQIEELEWRMEISGNNNAT